MKRTTTAGLAAVGGFIVLLVAASAAFIDLDAQGLRGTAIGAGLGILNFAVGYLVTRRALRQGMKSALRTLLAGFLVRLVAVAGVMVVLHRTKAADPAAFGLTFMVFFFAYLGVEVLLVERSLNGTGRAA
jgi:hypothetical protein